MICCQSSFCMQQGSLSHRACPQLREETEHADVKHPYSGHMMVSKSRWLLIVNAWVTRGCSHSSINSVTQCVCVCVCVPRSKCVLCCLNYMWQQAPKLAIYSLSPWSLEQYLGQGCSLSISFPSAIHCFCCSKEQHAVEVHACVTLPTPLAYFCARGMEQPQEPPGCKLHEGKHMESRPESTL